MTSGGSERNVRTGTVGRVLHVLIRAVFYLWLTGLMLVAFGISLRIEIGSLWHWLPVCVGPLFGICWIFRSTREISKGTKKGYQWLSVPIYFLFAYATLGVSFGVGYLGLNKLCALGNQVVCVKHNYECVMELQKLLYFSFVTGSTLGYGDLLPEGMAGILVSIQVVIFIMFVGVGMIYVQDKVERRTCSSPYRPVLTVNSILA